MLSKPPHPERVSAIAQVIDIARNLGSRKPHQDLVQFGNLLRGILAGEHQENVWHGVAVQLNSNILQRGVWEFFQERDGVGDDFTGEGSSFDFKD